MKILMLSATFPYPPGRGGTQVRTFNLLKYLSGRHHVILGTLRSIDVTDAQIEELREYVAELAVFPHPQIPPQPPRTQGGLRGRQGLFLPPPLSKGGTEGGFSQILGKLYRFSQFLLFGTPPNVFSNYSPAMQQWADELVAAGKCDVVTCEHSVNEIYVRPEWQQKVLTVANIHSSVWGTCRQILATGNSEKLGRDRLNLPLLARYEQRYCAKFSRIVATTETDKQQLLELLSPPNSRRGGVPAPAPPVSEIHVIPNGVDLAEFPYRDRDPGGYTLIFAGAMNNLPNIDAVRFLSLEILPLLQQRYPETTLTVVGTSPVPEVLALGERSGIQIVGRVQRVAEYLHKAAVCAIPMRMGLGIKNKTLEAMAAGTPIVASDRALEGLSVDGGGRSLRALRANGVQEYVDAITSLFDDRHLREELSRNGRSLVESKYTWEIVGRQYEQVLQF